MEFKQFLGMVYFLTYRRPIMLLVNLLGVVFVVWGVLALAGVLNFSAFTPAFTLIYGFLFLAWIPVSTYVRARRLFESSKRYQELRTFEFSKVGFKAVTESTRTETAWSAVYEVREVGRFLLIFLSRAEAVFIPIAAFSKEDLSRLMMLTREVKGLRTRWKTR